MTAITSFDKSILQQWINEKLDAVAVEEKLKSIGFSAEEISSHIKEYKKLRSAKRQFRGFVFLGIGAFLGFVSCTLTLINPIPSLYYHILYGLTSVSMTFIFLGLYFVFEG